MKVLMLAGEASGDRIAAAIARELRRVEPGVAIAAMGGSELRAAGAEVLVDSTRLAVVGLTEVVPVLPELLRARRTLRRWLEEERLDVVVPVDYPDFNLCIAEAAARRGIPVAWMVSPQVWAWRPGRVRRYARSVTRMLVVFPFEAATWRAAGVGVEDVGHPLLDLEPPSPPRSEARARLGLPQDAPVLALLPGSRRSEVARNWPVMARAAVRLADARPALRIVVPLAPGLPARVLGRPAPDELAALTVPDGARDVLSACDAAAVASGTATLQAALVPRAFVACYRVGALTMRLGRRLADPGFLARGLFALPNLVLGRAVVPELYQERFTDEALAAELAPFLDDPLRRAALEAELASVRPALGGPGACGRAARAIVSVAQHSAPVEGGGVNGHASGRARGRD